MVWGVNDVIGEMLWPTWFVWPWGQELPTHREANFNICDGATGLLLVCFALRALGQIVAVHLCFYSMVWGVAVWVISFSWALGSAAESWLWNTLLLWVCNSDIFWSSDFIQLLHVNISYIKSAIGFKGVSETAFSELSWITCLWFSASVFSGRNTKWKWMSGTEIVQEKSDLQMHAISCPALAFLIFSLHV